MRKKERGTVLITVIIICLIVSISGMMLTLTLQDYARMEGKGRDELKAFYAAEAGCLEVVTWFNLQGAQLVTSTGGSQYPNEGDSGFNHTLFLKNDDDLYQNMANKMASYQQGTGLTVPSQYYPILRDENGNETGRVTSLEITNPTDGDRARIPYLLCVVRCEGLAEGGATKRAVLYLAYHRLKLDGAPGVLLSRDVASFGGNVAAHWGEVWGHGNLKVPLYSQMVNGYTRADDPWLNWRGENALVWDASWGVPNWMVDYTRRGQTFIVNNTVQPADGVLYNDIGIDFGDMFYQNQTLEWPVYDYADTKKIAMKKGRYYSTDAAGNLYRDGIEDDEHLVTDLRELNQGTAADRSAWGDLNYDCVFVDTIDGNPPAADGSNIATLVLSGGGFSWKGFYYICANLDLRGMGQPSPPISCDDPGGNYQDLNIFMDGILVCRGMIDSGTGNHIIYGSVFGEHGYIGNGTLDVYYNWRLANGFPFAIDNRVELVLWKFES